MDAEQARAFLLALPHVVETEQWGHNLVFWVGDKAIGGKMFALIDLDDTGQGKISYAAGAARYAESAEIEGLFPAPYMARIYWIAAGRWDVFRNTEWQDNSAPLTRSPSPSCLRKSTRRSRCPRRN